MNIHFPYSVKRIGRLIFTGKGTEYYIGKVSTFNQKLSKFIQMLLVND